MRTKFIQISALTLLLSLAYTPGQHASAQCTPDECNWLCREDNGGRVPQACYNNCMANPDLCPNG